MIKCMYQDCDCKATITIPGIIGPKKLKEDIHVCEFHFNLMRQPEPFVSMEIIKEDEKDD